MTTKKNNPIPTEQEKQTKPMPGETDPKRRLYQGKTFRQSGKKQDEE